MISKPKNTIKKVQKQIKEDILDKLEWEKDIQGFLRDKSNLTNARLHENSRIFVNVDIKDFFANTKFDAVRLAFRRLGYSGEISSVLALLTTYPETKELNIKDQTWYAFSDKRSLPQGASTSPLISNLTFLKADEQFRKRAKSLEFQYSRYADDLTFSSPNPKIKLKPLIYMIHKTLDTFNYKPNMRKFKILGNNKRQEVTGISLNEGLPLIPREWRRKVRAGIHQNQFMEGDEKENHKLSMLGSLSYMRLTHRIQASQYAKKLNQSKK